MKTNTLLINLVIVIFSVSCKISQKLPGNASVTNIGNMTFPTERSLTGSELNIGRRICAALKKKREKFETLYDGETKFTFQRTAVDCQGNNISGNFDASIFKNPALTYSAPSQVSYFSDIITDQSEGISDICTSLSSSDNISNTVKVGNLKYTITFLIADNYDRVDIRKDVSDGKGGFNTTGAESTSVITQSSEAGKINFGVEKERTRYTLCDDNKFRNTKKQIWIKAL